MMPCMQKKENLPLSSFIREGVATTLPDTPLSDILQVAADSKYPIAVLDEKNRLKGIVSRSAVLSSFVNCFSMFPQS